MRGSSKSRALELFILLALAVLAGGVASAVCIDVDGDGFGDTGSTLSDCTYDYAYDCNDNNVNNLPPYDNMLLSTHTILCPGTYYINDSGSYGVIIFNAQNVNLTCNGTILVGNTSRAGVYAYRQNGSVVKGCSISGYQYGVFFYESSHTVVNNLSAWNNTDQGLSHILGINWSVTDSRFWLNYEGMISDYSSDDGSVSSSVFYNNSGSGIYLLRSQNVTLRDSLAENNTWAGVRLWMMSDASILNVSSRNSSSGDGIALYVCNYTNISFSNVTSNSNGIRLSESNMTYIFRNDISANTDRGIYLVSSNNNTVRNCSLTYNNYGVNLESVITGSGNLFYYNNFTGNSVYHAFADTAANYFNTTNGSDCGAQCARGNYWDDILTLDILDLNDDGFGDSGSEYPYNSSFTSMVYNAEDWGPITSKTCSDNDGDGFGVGPDISLCTYTHAQDCDDTDSSILPPADDLTISADSTLCSGTYYVNDSLEDGLVKLINGSIDLTCDGTVVIGNGTGIGITDHYPGNSIEGCVFSNFSIGLSVGGLWNLSLGWNSSGNSMSWDLTLDSEGNIIMVGNWENGASYDWGVAKYDYGMNQLWNRTLFWGAGTDRAYKVTTDTMDNIIIGGYWDNGGQDDWGVAKYDPDGTQLWNFSVVWNSTADDIVEGVVTDSSDDIYVLGDWYNGAWWDWGLMKLDSDGNQVWNRTLIWNASMRDNAGDLAIDSNDDLILAGYLGETTSKQTWAFAKYDTAGNQLWNRSRDWGGTGEQILGVAADSDDNIILAGYYRLISNDDVALMKYDSAGNYLWNTTAIWNDTAWDIANSVDIDSRDNILIGGRWYHNTNFDGLAMKFSPDGVQLWNRSITWNSTDLDFIYSVVAGPSDELVLGGYGVDDGGYNNWHIIRLDGEGDDQVSGSYARNNTFANSSSRGIYISGFAYSNNFTNCTLAGNADGAFIEEDPSGNLFYYNNFSGNTIHANATSSANNFNTSYWNGTAWVAHGNWWDDVAALDIFDTDYDGFGNNGPDYPYNATHSTMVSGNVTDWGPMTWKIGCTDNDGDGFGVGDISGCTYTHAQDCDDTNANILPPYDEMLINTHTILCSGTYYINDSGSYGVIRFNANDVNLTCNGTVIIGNTSGGAIYSGGKYGVVVKDCSVSTYDRGVFFVGSNTSVENLSAWNNTYAGISYSACKRGDLSGSRFWLNARGVLIDFSRDLSVRDSEIYNNSWGMHLYRSSNLTVAESVVENQSISGIRLWLVNDSNIFNITSRNNVETGILISSSLKTNVSLSEVTGNQDGIFLSSSNDTFMFMNNVSGNSDKGIYFSASSRNNTVRNCSIMSQVVGASLSSDSISNIFYFNNFTNSAVAHAYADAAGNHFNTTNGSDCGPLCARGNYWDDILSLDIFDSNADGFGDDGTDYPYNAANGGNVSANVQDEGPITTKGPSIIVGGGNLSMTIYGINGTEITGSRNVLLNLSYNETVVAACRWANDDSGNLASQSWEPCTTVKAWILSESYGNKTVFFQVLNLDSGTNATNDSIMYQYMQDYTPPTAPAVYDGLEGDDIDWWNSNDTLHAHWFNATEDISTIYYRYRILNESVCSGSCAFTNVSMDTSVTETGLRLEEGRTYSFEVVASNEDGLNVTAISNGTVIDLTKPDAPIINSSTHPTQTDYYDSSVAIFNFSADDPLGGGVASGVEGFSYLLDKHPGTAPDNIMEDRDWESLAEMHKGTFNQTLKYNQSGLAYAVFSQLHSNFSVGDRLRVRVALAEQFSDYDDLMNVKVYLVKAGGEGTAIGAFDKEASAISNIENVSGDIAYAETMNRARVYQFNLTVTEALNDNADDAYIAISGTKPDDDNTQPHAIAGTTNPLLIDSGTRLYVCDENDVAGCDNNSTTLEVAVSVEREDSGTDWSAQYEYLPDGTYYFHVKAKDRAGNWGDPSHYRILVAAGGVASLIYSPVDGEVFTTTGTETNITVKVSVSANASVRVIAKHEDGSNFTSDPPVIFNRTHEFENITLEMGENELYAETNSTAGAVAHSPSVFVTVYAGVAPFTNKTLRIRYLGCAGAGSYICNSPEGTSYVGIGTEDGSISAPSVQADTTMNSLKIYMTRQFDTAIAGAQLAQNTFLDRINPAFGFSYGSDAYTIRNELRYRDLHLGGDFYLRPGVYKLYIRKTGMTADGKYNITLYVE